MSESTIFHIEGGIGKNIVSTAVVECYKKHYPDEKITVVCSWPEVYINNPYIDRVYRIGAVPYFYRDFIYNKDVKIFAQEPYKETSHITKQKHLIQTWCSMVGAEHTNESPKLFFNFREHEIASTIIQNPENKPVLIFQPFGGPGKEHQSTPYSWTRDIHPNVAQTLVNILSKKYHVVHVCYEFHPKLYNCQRIDVQLQKKVLFSLLTQSSARLLIDSSLQHAAAALNLPSTVVWVATHPKIFGYNIHKNVLPIITHENGTADSYLYDYNFTGSIHECPYSYPHEIFDIETIIKCVDES